MGVEFRCTDVGISCTNVARAETAEDLVAAVGEHAQRVHGVALNATLVDYAVTTVRASHGSRT